MATGLQISLEGKAYSIDDFELGDLEWLEEHVGAPIMDEKTLTSMKTIVGFVYLIKRRDDPEFTLEDARKIKLSVMGYDDDEDGEDGESKPAKRRPTKAARSS